MGKKSLMDFWMKLVIGLSLVEGCGATTWVFASA
jgi:hypothetical protein